VLFHVASMSKLTESNQAAGIIATTPFFMGIAAIKFKGGDMEAMGKNLGGSVLLFLVPKIVETLITWAAK